MTPGHLLSFRGVDYQDGEEPALASIWFDIAAGFAEPPEIRGRNTVVPSRDGQIIRPKRADHLIIELPGFVRGLGQDHDERRSAWRTATDVLMATLDRTLTPGPLVVTGPYLGVPDGEQWTIDAVASRIIPGLVQSHMSFQRWSLQLVAYDVDWEPVGSSS